jgi:Domain of unknown function (DUF4262)
MANKKLYHASDFDELLQKTKVNIEKFGLQVISINASSYLPSFSYSIGLWQRFQHPEIICFGLKIDLMHALINDVAEIIKRGEKIETARNYTTLFNNLDAQFLSIDPRNVGDYFGLALKYYKCDLITAMQLVWPDNANRFPWEADFQENLIYKQPLLDRNADFKFREAKNLGIFTTRQWLELDQPILRVVHGIDGDWQFLTGDQLLEDARIVSLDELVQKDSTLNEVFNLDYREAADRSHFGGEWTRGKVDGNDNDHDDPQ